MIRLTRRSTLFPYTTLFRSGIVDEDALFYALKNNHIWAAGLDVFEEEPISLDHPLLELPNVVTLLHIDRKSTRLNSSHVAISYAVFCLKKKKKCIIASMSRN